MFLFVLDIVFSHRKRSPLDQFPNSKSNTYKFTTFLINDFPNP